MCILNVHFCVNLRGTTAEKRYRTFVHDVAKAKTVEKSEVVDVLLGIDESHYTERTSVKFKIPEMVSIDVKHTEPLR